MGTQSGCARVWLAHQPRPKHSLKRPDGPDRELGQAVSLTPRGLLMVDHGTSRQEHSDGPRSISMRAPWRSTGPCGPRATPRPAPQAAGRRTPPGGRAMAGPRPDLLPRGRHPARSLAGPPRVRRHHQSRGPGGPVDTTGATAMNKIHSKKRPDRPSASPTVTSEHQPRVTPRLAPS